MRRFITDTATWLIVLGALLILFSVQQVLGADLDKLQSQALGVSAQLNNDCSATLIHSERDAKSGEVLTVFLTAKHCVANRKDRLITVNIPVYQNSRIVKHDAYVAKVRGQHFKHDLALVELVDKQTWFEKKAKIAPVDGIPPMGAPVVTVGYPTGRPLTVTAGLFGSLETIDFPKPGTEYFRATPSIIGGNSGGAMFRTTDAGDYELIGVSSAVLTGAWFMGYYVPLEAIHEYLKVALPATVAK